MMTIAKAGGVALAVIWIYTLVVLFTSGSIVLGLITLAPPVTLLTSWFVSPWLRALMAAIAVVSLLAQALSNRSTTT